MVAATGDRRSKKGIKDGNKGLNCRRSNCLMPFHCKEEKKSVVCIE
jgi:hypothetical protein